MRSVWAWFTIEIAGRGDGTASHGRQGRMARRTAPRVRRRGPAGGRLRVSARHQGGGRVRPTVVLVGVAGHVPHPQDPEQRDREVRQCRQHPRQHPRSHAALVFLEHLDPDPVDAVLDSPVPPPPFSASNRSGVACSGGRLVTR